MSFFEFPHTRTYDSDLGFIIKWITENNPTIENLTEWKNTHEAQYNQLLDMVEGLQNSLIDVIVPWDSSIAYHIFSICEYQGQNYIAIQDVPIGTMITNTDYWAPANTVIEQVNAIGNTVNEVKAVYPRRDYFMPEDFGAVRDDNTVDSGPAIRQAIEAANDAGGIVLLTDGIYYVYTPIVITEHLYGVKIIGAGDSYNGVNFGTRIVSDISNDIVLHFSNGTWGCDFSDFSILCTGSDSIGIRFSNDNDNALTARTHRTTLKNVSIRFRYHGMEIQNAAYFWIDNCTFSGHPDYSNDNDRVGIYIGDLTNNRMQNEYITFMNCRIVPNIKSSGTTLTYNSIGLFACEGVHTYLYNVDITDSDYGIYLHTKKTIGFINSIVLNLARVHIGVMAELDGNALQNTIFEHTIYTAVSDNNDAVNDRLFKSIRTSGGNALNAKIKMLNNTLRTGFNYMTYWIEGDSNTLAPGNFQFTYLMSVLPKEAFGATTQSDPNYSTLEWMTSQTLDLNDYYNAGFYPIRFSSASTNSPGFECMLVVYANPATSIQIAIPTAASQSFKFRIYTKSSGTFSAWNSVVH